MPNEYHVAMPYFSEDDIAWIQEKVGVVLRGKLSTGPFVKEFEEKFAQFVGTQYAVCLNTCSSALEIALKSVGLKEGDEVIVPGQTFIATGMSVTLNGGKVVFAEIDPQTFCLTLDEIKKRKTNKTKGVMLVYFGGYMSPDTLAIQQYCRENGLFLIEDAAHAHGSSIDGQKAGAIGDAGCFSFFSTKIMTTGEGGMLTTNSKDIYEMARSLRERGTCIETKQEIYTFPWRSSRVPEITAVLGLSQLFHLNEWLEMRNKVAAIYNKAFEKSEDLHALPNPANIYNAYWKHIAVIDNPAISRKDLAETLKAEYKININWAYEPALHLQPVYRKMYGINEGHLPVTEAVMKRHFHLPMHVGLTEDDARYIAKSVLEAVERVKNVCQQS